MKRIRDILRSLKMSRKLHVYCPQCDKAIYMKNAELFTADSLTPSVHRFLDQKKQEIEELKMELNNFKKKKLERVQRGTQSSNLGKILERFVPILPGFMHKAEESIPLLDPIDYISFDGLSKGRIKSITFMDIKSGKGRLGDQQKSIKAAIEAGKIALEYIGRSTK